MPTATYSAKLARTTSGEPPKNKVNAKEINAKLRAYEAKKGQSPQQYQWRHRPKAQPAITP